MKNALKTIVCLIPCIYVFQGVAPARFLMSCGSRESIKNTYLYSETVMQLLTDQEYYDLDKNAKWPNEGGSFCYISDNNEIMD